MFGNKTAKIEKLAAKKKSDELTKYLKEKDSSVRLAAIKGLGEAGGEVAFNNLVILLRDPDANARKAAAAALEVLKDPKAGSFINARLNEEADEGAKTAMKRALTALHESV